MSTTYKCYTHNMIHEEVLPLLLTQSGRKEWNVVAQWEPVSAVQNSGTEVRGGPPPLSQM